MKIETWYYLLNHQIKEVYLYKEDGRYTKLCVEEAGIGYQSIPDFPHRLYKDKQHALDKLIQFQREDKQQKLITKYKRTKRFTTEEEGGFSEHKTTINFRVSSDE